MLKAPIPIDEPERLADLRRLAMMHTAPEEFFDRVTSDLAKLFEVPVATMSLVDSEVLFFKAQHGLPPDVAAKRVLPRDITLCGHVVGNNETIVVDDLACDQRFADNPIVTGTGARFYAGTPLRSENGHAVGSLCLIDVRPRSISEHERRFLQLTAEMLMNEVRLRRLAQALAAASAGLEEKSRAMEADLSQARRAQEFLLPPDDQPFEGYRICHLYRPYAHLGGDFLDVHRAASGHTTLLLADVTGHGTSAALISSMLKASFQRAVAGGSAGPEEILNAINRDLAGLVEGGRFVTAVAAAFTPAGRKLSIASAGHPHPLLLSGGIGGPVETENDPPLLIDPDHRYTHHVTFPIPAGGSVLFYTDGAVEVKSAGGELGVSGLLRLTSASRPKRGPALLNAIWNGIESAGTPGDDVALLMLECE